MAQGPLDGVKVLEFAGLGPAPFCGMLLADQGADVVRVDRRGGGTDVLGQPPGSPHDVTARGRRSVALDLKSEAGLAACLKLAQATDILIEGFRPGVMERLGLGPEALLAHNPKLVYGRMTGWGQTGPLAKTSGHDLNYISLSGVLHAIGPAAKPVPPLNIAGDGGGALYLAFGVMAALTHARTSGQGQVVDCAMTDTSASLAAMFYGFQGASLWQDQRGVNLLDGGAPFYDVYACADGGFLSVAPLEPQFYAVLLEKLGLDGHPRGREDWPRLREAIAGRIATRTRDEWQTVFEGSEACVAPVLTMDEAHRHPHNQARQAFVEVAGVRQPAPAPRFSATPGRIQGPPPIPGADTVQALADWGLSPADIAAIS